MLIIPAIDLKDGRCVRLFQGEMDKETVYFEDPLAAAKHWIAEGATFIHIVGTLLLHNRNGAVWRGVNHCGWRFQCGVLANPLPRGLPGQC